MYVFVYILYNIYAGAALAKGHQVPDRQQYRHQEPETGKGTNV
jgi:hypothetical protein